MPLQLLVAWLLQMATNDKAVRKGGTAAYLASLAAHEVATATGPRSLMRRTEGVFGFGPYANEPWSLQVRVVRVSGGSRRTCSVER